MLGLTTNPEKAMVFTLGTEVPTANESIDAKESSIVVVAGNGVVTIKVPQAGLLTFVLY